MFAFAVLLTIGGAAIWMGPREPLTDGRGAAGRVYVEGSPALRQRLASFIPPVLPGEEIFDAVREVQQSFGPLLSDLTRQLDPRRREPNLRVTVSGELLNRLLSGPRVAAAPVRPQLDSMSIVGEGRTRTELFLRLVPTKGQWRLQLIADGTVAGDARVSAGGATFFVAGGGNFQSTKLMVLDRRELHLGAAEASGNFDFRLSGVQTNMDVVPLVGLVAQEAAISRFRMQRTATRQRLAGEVENQARQTLDRETATFVDEARGQLGPLRNLGLPLMPVRMRTTEEQLVGDYCLAGFRQTGAEGIPPNAPAGSLVSVQLHESAIINAVQRMQLGGREGRLRDMCGDLFSALGVQDAKPLERIPAEISICLAYEQPLRVEFCDGEAHLAVKLARFAIGEKQWSDFAVHCTYRFDDSSPLPTLSRIGKVKVEGSELGVMDRIVLNSVFARMLECAERVPLVPGEWAEHPGLASVAVTQCDMECGWLALAAGPLPQASSHVAEAAVSSQR